MKTTEEQIRDLLVSEERRAPLAADAMPGIHRGIARGRHRRAGTVVAAAVAVAAAVTVPLAMHGSPQSRPAKTPTATQSSKPTTAHFSGLTRISTLSPTWIPAGLAETGRSAQLHDRTGFPAQAALFYASRDSGNDGEISVTDFSAAAHVPKTGTVPVTIAGRTGKGWASTDPKGYDIQVKWKAGHWLDIDVAGFNDDKATAVRVGNSIVERTTAVNVPVTCEKCSTINDVNISGSKMAPYVQLIGSRLSIGIDTSRHSPQATRSLGHGFYVHVGSPGGQADRPYPKSVYSAIANSFRVHGKLDFSWLGKRP